MLLSFYGDSEQKSKTASKNCRASCYIDKELKKQDIAVKDGKIAEIGKISGKAKEVFDRLAGTWTYWGWKAGYFDSESDQFKIMDYGII